MTSKTCKATLTTDQFFNSCTSNGLLDGITMPILDDKESTNQSDIIYYIFANLKTFLENTGYIEYIYNPLKIEQDISRLPQNNLDISENHSPNIFHALWITNKENPRQINDKLSNFLLQKEKLDGYQVNIWTNIDEEVLIKMNPSLLENNIQVKNIADIKTDYPKLLDFVLSPTKYFTPKFNSSLNGLLIDLSKNLIMESQGGILADLNFSFDKEFKHDNIKKYDFIAGCEKNRHYIENGYFIAKAHHPIFKEILNIIDEMIFNPDCALHSLRENLSNSYITEIFSMLPIFLSYTKFNNQNGNLDGLAFGCHKQDNIREDENSFEENSTIDIEFQNDHYRDFTKIIDNYLIYKEDYPWNENMSCITDPIGLDSQDGLWRGASII